MRARAIADLSLLGKTRLSFGLRSVIIGNPHVDMLSPMDRRLHRARGLLINHSELPIERMALRLGFSSSSHFSSAFRRQTGLTPTDFRKICLP
jgi:hypothetical protein